MKEHGQLFEVVKCFCSIDLHPYKLEPDGKVAVDAEGRRVDNVSNLEMGYVFEELIRRFSEQANEDAGDYFTPREVIRFMVNLLFNEDGEVLRKAGKVRTLYDPACGTGGMLSVAQDYLYELNPEATLQVFGQEHNKETYAICKADMLLKGQNPDNIKFGNSFTEDGLPDERFSYCMSNPPFGVEWKTQQPAIEREASRGHAGRFGAGLPRINDGSLLFLQHMVSKMRRPEEGGTRIAVVFNGSPLFTGGAASGESDIRKWLIENDWLEAIIALPESLFYNTGISTYVWLVTNRKSKARIGKVQLVNGASFHRKMRRPLGEKRLEIGDQQIAELTQIYGDLRDGEHVRVLDNADLGYQRITVERPLRLNFEVTPERLQRLLDGAAWKSPATFKATRSVGGPERIDPSAVREALLRALKRLPATRLFRDRRLFEKAIVEASRKEGFIPPKPLMKALFAGLGERDEAAEICRDEHSQPEPDPELRDFENVPLKQAIPDFMAREVLPVYPDAWVADSLTRVGYEIPFGKYFYKYTEPRPLALIAEEARLLEAEIQRLLIGALG